MSRSLSSLIARVALVVLVAVSADIALALPNALPTPAGLANGATFRFLFVTAGTISGTATDIATYNTFVQNEAGGATYNGNTVNWKAIASTAAVNARDNVGGLNTLVPVYLPSGAKLANNLLEPDEEETVSDSLWIGTLFAPPNEQIDGTTVTVDPYTGTNDDGTANFFAMGSEYPLLGGTDSANRWLGDFLAGGSGEVHQMYGLSEELTVGGGAGVPEIDPAGIASVLSLVVGSLGVAERRLRRGARWRG